MNRLLLSLCLASSLLPLVPTSASACSCAPATPEQYAKWADVVFTGVARDVTEAGMELATVFRVRVVYKGHASRVSEVHSGAHEESCGFRFREGTKYTVFADRGQGELSTNLCSGTKRGRIRHARYGLPPGRRF